jgi:hypothetical protein
MSDCFQPQATDIEVQVGSPVLADREQAWMAMSEAVR